MNDSTFASIFNSIDNEIGQSIRQKKLINANIEANKEEEERKRRAEAQKLVYTNALAQAKDALESGELPASEFNKIVQNLQTGKFTGLPTSVKGDFQPTGFTKADIEGPAFADVPKGNIRMNPETRKYELGTVPDKPIDYRSGDKYIIGPNGQLTLIPGSRGKSAKDFIRAPVARKTPEEIKAEQDARNQSNAQFGVGRGAGRGGSAGIKETPEEKSNRKLAEKAMNDPLSTPEKLEWAANILNWEKVVTPGEKGGFFSEDVPDTISYRPRKSKSDSQPSPTGGDTALRDQAVQILTQNKKQVNENTIKMVMERLGKQGK